MTVRSVLPVGRPTHFAGAWRVLLSARCVPLFLPSLLHFFPSTAITKLLTRFVGHYRVVNRPHCHHQAPAPALRRARRARPRLRPSVPTFLRGSCSLRTLRVKHERRRRTKKALGTPGKQATMNQKQRGRRLRHQQRRHHFSPPRLPPRASVAETVRELSSHSSLPVEHADVASSTVSAVVAALSSPKKSAPSPSSYTSSSSSSSSSSTTTTTTQSSPAFLSTPDSFALSFEGDDIIDEDDAHNTPPGGTQREQFTAERPGETHMARNDAGGKPSLSSLDSRAAARPAPAAPQPSPQSRRWPPSFQHQLSAPAQAQPAGPHAPQVRHPPLHLFMFLCIKPAVCSEMLQLVRIVSLLSFHRNFDLPKQTQSSTRSRGETARGDRHYTATASTNNTATPQAPTPRPSASTPAARGPSPPQDVYSSTTSLFSECLVTS